MARGNVACHIACDMQSQERFADVMTLHDAAAMPDGRRIGPG
jgi:hypothetical protein